MKRKHIFQRKKGSSAGRATVNLKKKKLRDYLEIETDNEIKCHMRGLGDLGKPEDW